MSTPRCAVLQHVEEANERISSSEHAGRAENSLDRVPQIWGAVQKSQDFSRDERTVAWS